MFKTNSALRSAGAACFWVILGLGVVSCRDATQITLRVHTNVPCTDPAEWKGVAVYVGSPGSDAADRAPALTSVDCDANGDVGSLVLVPSGDKDAEIALRVVAGIDMKPEECAAKQYRGCIVARRTVRFSAHASLELDIDLTTECLGKSCDAMHTCVNGTCADPVTEMAAFDPTVASVRCGDQGVRCGTSGDVCCLTTNFELNTTSGVCKPARDCDTGSTVLNCDDSSDCAQNTSCHLFYTITDGAPNDHHPYRAQISECVPFEQGHIELCDRSAPCKSGQLTFPCHAGVGHPANPLPGYYWCDD